MIVEFRRKEFLQNKINEDEMMRMGEGHTRFKMTNTRNEKEVKKKDFC